MSSPGLLLLCAFLLCFYRMPLNAQSGPSQWIAPPGTTSTSVGVYSFRKVVTLAARPSTAPIHISADNRFILYVNGKRIGDGPARGDLEHWRYETFDIAAQLHAGNNVIAATVWSFGAMAPTAQMSYRPALLLWTDLPPLATLNTNESWRVRLEPAWSLDSLGSFVGPAMILDASKFDWRWNRSTSVRDVSSWSQATNLNAPVFAQTSRAPAKSWTLVPDQLPPMEYLPVPSGKIVRSTPALTTRFPQQPVTVPQHSHLSLSIDRGALTTAYPELTVNGGEGSRVRLTYAEALYDSHHQKGDRSQIDGKTMDPKMTHDEFLPDGGIHRSFRPLWWRSWRYLQLDIDTGRYALKVESLRTIFTAYPFAERATLQSSDPQLARIWDVGWRTIRADAHETYMDCPYWEQMQYVGDTRIEALVTYTVSGDDRLAQQALRAFANSQMPSGLTQSRYPSHILQVIPPFSLLWIGMLRDYWWYRPDNGLAKELLPVSRGILDWFTQHQRPDGLFARMPKADDSEWDFMDWAKQLFPDGMPPQDSDGGSIAISLQLVAALRDAADLEDAFGDTNRATTYRANAARIATSAYNKAWDADHGLLADTPSKTSFSQQTNILGVWLDVIPKDRQRQVMQTILADELAGKPAYPASPRITPASYYFRFYLARALDHAGMSDLYLHLLGPWHEMLSLGLSTWAEEPEPTRSDAHAWSSHPNYDLITLVAGIKPATAGFRSVSITPHLGGLKTLDVSMPHPHGTIRVSYRQTTKGLSASIDLPPGVDGTFAWKGTLTQLHSGSQQIAGIP